MRISFKKLLILAFLGLLLAGLVRERTSGNGYIIPDSKAITLDLVQKARSRHSSPATSKAAVTKDQEKTADAGTTPPASGVSLVDYTTIGFFRHLMGRFEKGKDLSVHLEQVLEYLLSMIPPEEALALHGVYEKFLNCEVDLAAETASWAPPHGHEAVLRHLRRMHAFRRYTLGDELADLLFGAEVKSREYVVRRSAIVADPDMYGIEKETRLLELNQDMWGDEAGAVEAVPKPYQRYREKLAMYERDLESMYPEEKEAMVREFRSTIFSADIVSRLEAVDRALAEEKQRDAAYTEAAAAIQNDPDLTPAKREAAVSDLRESLFGEEAEARRRRDVMARELERLRAGG
ncbi:MAG: lipase chaperone [Desulfobacteraceae bacterium]|nr:lipase chaperone [Desulfobacteraceae bacterium]